MSAMDIKLNHSQKVVDEQWMSRRKRFFGFFRDLKEELKKVSWTTREELIFATKMVVSTTFFLGIGIYLMDLLIKGSLDAVALVVHYIFS